MIHPSWASPGRQLPACRTWVNRNPGPYPAWATYDIGRQEGREMTDLSEGFLGLGLDDALTRRQVLQAGLTGATMLGLAACRQSQPAAGGTSAGPGLQMGAVMAACQGY